MEDILKDELKDDKQNENSASDDDQENTENESEDEYGEILTFDEILADKFYQSEFDRRMQKGIQTAVERVTKEYETRIEELNNKFGQAAESTAEQQEVSQRYSQEIDGLKNEIEQVKKNHVVELAVAKTGVIDPVALKAHVKKFVDKAKYNEGEIEGLDDHIKELLNDKLSYLLPQSKKALGKDFSGGVNKEKSIEEKIMKQFDLKEDSAK